MMKKIKYTISILLLSGLFAGCGSDEKRELQEIDPIKVETGIAKTSKRNEVISVSGKMEAGNSANISTRVMGNVTSVLVKPGDKVKKGNLLLTISSADLSAKKAQIEASIIQARSGFENAEKDYQRFKILYEKGSASEKELENMETRYKVQKAGLKAALEMEKEINSQFSYTNLRAPFSGVVGNTFVKLGDMANPGMPLATVEGVSNYEATVMVPETQISKVKIGADAKVTIKSTNQVIKGEVKEISPSSKNTGGQFIAKIDLENKEGIMPGMFVNAEIAVSENAGNSSPLVPQEVLIQNGQLTGLYAFGANNTAILRWVRIGKVSDGMVEVISGLKEGEKYVFNPQGKLFNGAPVVVNQLANKK